MSKYKFFILVYFLLEAASSFAQSSEHLVTLNGREYLKFGDTLAPVARIYYSSLRYWPNGVVPYELGDEVRNTTIENNFHRACQLWASAARITCRPKTNSDYNYVHVMAYDYSSSNTGVVGGEQALTVDRNGDFKHLVHEIGHLLGLEHEHVRADRDQYVKILWEQMYPEAYPDFYIKNDYYQSTPYDLDSVMHYPPGSATATGYATMISLDGRTRFGNTNGQLTQYDRIDIANIYGR